jgi:hypothetical protein
MRLICPTLACSSEQPQRSPPMAATPIVAWLRGHHNTLAIFLVNLLLGWSFLRWLIALIWSATVVQCPARRC